MDGAPAVGLDASECSGEQEASDGMFRPTGDGAVEVLGRALDDDAGEYYFESDHLSLKENEDYRALLKTVAILQVQRKKAVEDLEKLHEMKAEALADPIAFVERLQRGEDMHFPARQKIVELPHIDWEKYSRSVDPTFFDHRHATRHRREPRHPTAARWEGPGGSSEVAGGGEASAQASARPSEEQLANDLIIRGRVCNTGKPQTFNQLWSVEEQKKLEDLLLQFPPEEVEARRWEKIARALGNRSSQQVASRIQKYFIKLARAGLPVPGRIPSLSNCGRRLGSNRQHRHNRFLFQSSTFFASHDPPVHMSDYDEDGAVGGYSAPSSMDEGSAGSWSIERGYGGGGDHHHSADGDFSREVYNTAEYKELMFLKELKRQKERENSPMVPNQTVHLGYKCTRCGVEPIVGIRWRCMECSDINFCPDCCDSQMEILEHTSQHDLEGIREAANSQIDDDYAHYTRSDYNYLDPNYMPAT